MTIPIPTIITIAKGSQYLIQNQVEKNGLYGGGLDLRHARKIYLIRANLEWLYNLNNSAVSLNQTAYFLYALCAPANAIAAASISAGGTVTPITPATGNLPNPYDWIVAASTTSFAPLKVGDTTVALDGTNGTQDFRGYNIDFFRGGVTESTTSQGDGSTYYSWDRVTGRITLFNGAAALAERMRISPTFGTVTAPSTVGDFYQFE